MFIKLGSNHNISLLVTDINGVRITNDSPYVIIKNVGQSTYWNGISWGGLEFRIYLEHVMDGVYQYVFTPDTADLYEIVAKSDEYQVSKTETVEVYAEDFVSYQWMVGSEFTIKYPLTNISTVPYVKICKELNNMYWNGSAWEASSIYLPMTLIEGSISVYSVILDEESKYYITILDDANEMLMMVQATTNADNVPPVILTNKTFKSLDGTDGTITTESQNPLPGVKISVYDLITKDLISQTASDINGGWSLVLKPNKYYFVFEKDGYTPIGVQRTVS
ncbi:MAG: Carboxypeptidase regulatory-like domain [Herbinix sp.]|jgi:hypothetical protein|nr:Carboxypeptidase regulatory-like domain [Herbinix sp.]